MQFRKRILLFSIFLLIAIFVWFLNALGENYSDQIEYPLEYSDLPSDRVFVGEPPEYLELNVSSHGYALLRYRILKKPVPISFKVSSFNLNRPGQDSGRAYILTRYLKDQISSQLPAELKLLEIKPDTLHFHFARKIAKRLPVKPAFEFELDKQFTTRNGIQFEPDSVEVTGPDAILDTLRAVTTEHIDLGLLTRNYNEKVRLQKLEGLEYGLSRVNCIIELEKFTEVQLTIPIEVINLPDSLTMQTFPSRVKLTCNVGLSNYDRVNNNPFRALVDYSTLTEPKKVLDVSLQNIPVYLLSSEYYPKTVEYLISKK